MDEWMRDAEKDKDCRAIKEDFLLKFTEGYEPKTDEPNDICLYEFIKLVKENPELTFCFRGNSNSGEQVCIYRNNHAMFTITPKELYFDPNHLRYCENWEPRLKELVKKFKNENVPYPILIQKKEKGEIRYSAEIKNRKLSRPIDKSLCGQLEKLYEFFTEIFDVYFNYDEKDENKKINYFKKWFCDNDYKGKFSVKPYKPRQLEKVRQQQLFAVMKEQKDGYFFYDMEFQQQHEDKEKQKADKYNNKPDMLAIRFEAGKPKALVFVEVKCKREALRGTSGLEKHVECMENYCRPDAAGVSKLDVRCREAFLIMHQYKKLGFFDLTEEPNPEDYYRTAEDGRKIANLPLEILLVFTDDAAKEWEKGKNATDDIIKLKKRYRKVEDNMEKYNDKMDNMRKVDIPINFRECIMYTNKNVESR